MKQIQALLATSLLLFAASGATAREPVLKGNPDQGMLVFTSYCASCHGEEGRGDGPMAARLRRDFGVLPTDLSSEAWQGRRSNTELRKIIREGGQGGHRSSYMPAWGMTLTPRQVEDLLTYIRELPEGPAGEQPRASILDVQQQLELGRTLYSLYCIACHGRKGEGDGPLVEAAQSARKPPNFHTTLRNRSDNEIRAIASSGPAHAKFGLDPSADSWWHRPLSNDELDALTLYLRARVLKGH